MNQTPSNIWRRCACAFISLGFFIGASGAAPGSTVAQGDGLVGWWRAESNANDVLGANTGANTGVTFAAAKVGQGFVFDAVGDRIDLDNPSEFMTQNFTIECWFKRANTTTAGTASDDAGYIFSWGAGGYGLAILGDNNPYGEDNGEIVLFKVGASFISGPFNITDTALHHVAVTKVGSEVTFYLDGEASGELTYDPGFTFATNANIGNRGDAVNGSLLGTVDEVAIYSPPIGRTEMKRIFDAGAEGKATQLVTSATDRATAADNVTSLREAITAGNALAGTDKVGFKIPSIPHGLLYAYSAEGAANDSFGTLDGTLNNGTGFAAGKVGKAFVFDGADDSVGVAHNVVQNPSTQITIAAWINPDTSGHGRPILQKRTAANVGGFTFETTHSPFGNNNGLSWAIMIGGVYKTLLSPASAIANGVWQHVAATYDGATMRIFVNGAEIASMAQAGAIDVSTSPLLIGVNATNSAFAYDGKIDELQVFGRALDAAEIVSLVQYHEDLAEPPLVAPVAEYLAQNNANDSIGTNNGTMTNGAAFTPGPFGRAFLFDGLDDFVGTPAVTWGASTNMVVSAWIKTLSSGGTIASIAHDSVQDEVLLAVRNGRVAIHNHKSAGNYSLRQSSSFVNTGEWVHVAGVLSGGGTADKLHIFVNGVEEAGTTLVVGAPTNVVDTTPRSLRVGWRTNQIPSEAFRGSIDQVSVYNQALSQAQMAAEFDNILRALEARHQTKVGSVSGIALPAFTGNTVLDGFSQTGAAQNTNPVGQGLNTRLMIEANGTAAGASAIGINYMSGASNGTIRGLNLNSFGGAAIGLTSGSGVKIQGNYIGTNITGTAAVGPIGADSHGVGIAFGAGNNIGGTAPAARNLIANRRHGIYIVNASSASNKVEGNLIGLLANGATAAGNTGKGVLLESAPFTTVGGTVDGSGNTISANGEGGISATSGANTTTIRANYVGTRADGLGSLGNLGPGILIADSINAVVGGSTPGLGNRIWNNGDDGVAVVGATATGNRILGNSIFNNGGLGIDLANDGVTPNRSAGAAAEAIGAGPNNLQKHPVLTDVQTSDTLRVNGTLTAGASTQYAVDIFASETADPSGFGEGRYYLGSVNVTTNGSGFASFVRVLNPVNRGFVITATATDPSGNTSEFSAPLAVPGENAARPEWQRYDTPGE